MGIIAAAQIAIADITDPIQQDAAPASPSVGMLWLDTGVKPPLLKRWTGSQWETVNDTTEDFRQVEAQLTVMEDNIRTAVTDLSRLETSMLDKADMTQMKELLAGKADADLMLQLSTELKQTSQSITAIISQVAGLEGASDAADALLAQYQLFFRIDASGVTIGKSNSGFDVRIDNEKLSLSGKRAGDRLCEQQPAVHHRGGDYPEPDHRELPLFAHGGRRPGAAAVREESMASVILSSGVVVGNQSLVTNGAYTSYDLTKSGSFPAAGVPGDKRLP